MPSIWGVHRTREEQGFAMGPFPFHSQGHGAEVVAGVHVGALVSGSRRGILAPKEAWGVWALTIVGPGSYLSNTYKLVSSVQVWLGEQAGKGSGGVGEKGTGRSLASPYLASMKGLISEQREGWGDPNLLHFAPQEAGANPGS